MRHSLANLTVVMAVAAWIGVAHIFIGACIILEPQAILVSALAGLRWVTALYVSGDMIAGVLIIVVGAMATLGGQGLFPFNRATRLKLIAPQVVLLVFTVISILCTIVEGRYPDGYLPEGGTTFIVADQAVAGLVSLFHVVGVLMLPIRAVENAENWE